MEEAGQGQGGERGSQVQTGPQNLRDEGAELWGPLANRYGYTVPPSGTPFFQLGRAAVLCLQNQLVSPGHFVWH